MRGSNERMVNSSHTRNLSTHRFFIEPYAFSGSILRVLCIKSVTLAQARQARQAHLSIKFTQGPIRTLLEPRRRIGRRWSVTGPENGPHLSAFHSEQSRAGNRTSGTRPIGFSGVRPLGFRRVRGSGLCDRDGLDLMPKHLGNRPSVIGIAGANQAVLISLTS